MIETCDKCGAEFDPLESGFLGDLSGEGFECSFMTQITALCESCYQKETADEADD